MRFRAFRRTVVTGAMRLGVVLVTSGLVIGCGDKKDKATTQTVAKVNKEELTVHQINAALSRERGLRSDQGEEASLRILERLIDQELAVQKAAELKLDRDPRVVQAIEGARREIIARAYEDQVGEGAPKPTAEEVRKFYEENPALFRERRVYQIQEFVVQAAPEQVAFLRKSLQEAKSPTEAAQLLKVQGFKFASNQAVRAAEQLPLEMLGELAKLKDGQILVKPSTSGVNVLFVVASRLQAIDEVRASTAIEQFLRNDRKRRLVAQDRKALRAAAKIEYIGKFGANQPAVDMANSPSVADAAASAAAGLDVKQVGEDIVLKPHPSAASEIAAADSRVKAASDVDASSVRKGLGLK